MDLDVQDAFALGNIRSHIVVDDRGIGAGTASCLAEGCNTTTSLSVVAASCVTGPTFLAR